MGFKIGDVVRLKKDGPEKLHMIIEELVAGGAMCRSKCGLRRVWASLAEFELTHLADPYADLKQAIREALLSDEFLKAFAAAWLKTLILHKNELNLGESK